MALTPSQYDNIQERAVNPFRTNEANAVNRLTRILTLGQDSVLNDENIESVNPTTLKVLANSYIKDDVYIQFKEDVDVDFTDEDNYLSITDRGMDREGTYYLVLHYVFNETLPHPIAQFKILKNEAELTEQSLLLCKCIIELDNDTNQYVIASFDRSDCTYLYVDVLKDNIRHALLTLLNFCSSNKLRYTNLLHRVEILEAKVNTLENG